MQYFSTSSGRIELEISIDDARSGSHQGSCDDDIEALLRVPYIREQFAKIEPGLLSRELAEWGAWDAEELLDDDQNRARLLWLACGDIVDNFRDDDDDEFGARADFEFERDFR